MEEGLRLHCKKDEEFNIYFAEVTNKCFSCGCGHGKTEYSAIAEACYNALHYVETKFDAQVLFELCLLWKREEVKQ